MKVELMSTTMMKALSILTAVTLFTNSWSQTTTVLTDSLPDKQKAYGVRLQPSIVPQFYGLALGLVGSDAICNLPYTKTTNGINVQLFGTGFTALLNPTEFSYEAMFNEENGWMQNRNTIPKAVHNGLLISLFGTLTPVSNGIMLGGFSSAGNLMNGLSINGLQNKYTTANGICIALINQCYELNGIQIGLINRSTKLKGLQIGLWNINGQRKLPLINF
jgi:hypothetical protein